jgi:hypothetical protein
MPDRTGPRLALDVAESCEALGVSWDFWTQHVAPEVRIVRRGRRKLIAVAELERWLDANAHAVLDPRGATQRDAIRSGTRRGGVVKKSDRVLGVRDGG